MGVAKDVWNFEIGDISFVVRQGDSFKDDAVSRKQFFVWCGGCRIAGTGFDVLEDAKRHCLDYAKIKLTRKKHELVGDLIRVEKLLAVHFSG